jgi:type IV secretory pathway VirB10-like protein
MVLQQNGFHGEVAMKSILISVTLFILAAAFSAAEAQNKVYTWTDARGRMHITDEPPPQDASVKDVVEAPPPPPPTELREREIQRERRRDERSEERQRSEVEDALRRAREADEAAQEAIRQADEQTQRALDVRNRFGNTPSRREQFKYKIRAEVEKAEAAQAEAQRAVDKAKAASEEARTAVGQSQETKP